MGHIPGRVADGKITVPGGTCKQTPNYGLYGTTDIDEEKIYGDFLKERDRHARIYSPGCWSLTKVYQTMEQKLGIDARFVKEIVETMRKKQKMARRKGRREF